MYTYHRSLTEPKGNGRPGATSRISSHLSTSWSPRAEWCEVVPLLVKLWHASQRAAGVTEGSKRFAITVETIQRESSKSKHDQRLSFRLSFECFCLNIFMITSQKKNKPQHAPLSALPLFLSEDRRNQVTEHFRDFIKRGLLTKPCITSTSGNHCSKIYGVLRKPAQVPDL